MDHCFRLRIRVHGDGEIDVARRAWLGPDRDCEPTNERVPCAELLHVGGDP